jgi:hypothetical protein
VRRRNNLGCAAERKTASKKAANAVRLSDVKEGANCCDVICHFVMKMRSLTKSSVVGAVFFRQSNAAPG